MAKTVVGFFKTASEAEQVKRRLVVGHGYAAEAIRVIARDTNSTGAAHTPEKSDAGFGASISGFFNLLTGVESNDERRYTEAVQIGGALLTLTVSDEGAAAAAAQLARYGAEDIDKQDPVDAPPPVVVTAHPAKIHEVSIPIVEEELLVGKRQVQGGGVRVYSHVTERPVEENIRLREEHVTVERHSVNRPAIEADFEAFREGTIVLTETAEEAVVSKKARVVEEVVIGKEVIERIQTVKDTVRRTEIDVANVGTDRPSGE